MGGENEGMTNTRGKPAVPPRADKLKRYSTISRRSKRIQAMMAASPFQVELSVFMDYQRHINMMENIPFIVRSCINYISQHALKSEGIFRLSGSHSKMDHMKKAYASIPDLVSFEEEHGDVDHCVSGLLKQYLRQLPTPLLTFAVGEQLLTTIVGSQMEIDINQVNEKLVDLPLDHKHLLKAICELGVQIEQHKDINHMTFDNLATCIGPAVYWSPPNSDPTATISNVTKMNRIVKLIFESFSLLTALHNIPVVTTISSEIPKPIAKPEVPTSTRSKRALLAGSRMAPSQSMRRLVEQKPQRSLTNDLIMMSKGPEEGNKAPLRKQMSNALKRKGKQMLRSGSIRNLIGKQEEAVEQYAISSPLAVSKTPKKSYNMSSLRISGRNQKRRRAMVDDLFDDPTEDRQAKRQHIN